MYSRRKLTRLDDLSNISKVTERHSPSPFRNKIDSSSSIELNSSNCDLTEVSATGSRRSHWSSINEERINTTTNTASRIVHKPVRIIKGIPEHTLLI
jgi:hypothetical protein